jgi:hypothetical protein
MCDKIVVAPMRRLIAMIQTTWPNIRVGLYEHEDGRFQYIEEGLQPDESWCHFVESGFFDDIEDAKKAMVCHYCELTEDEYKVDPKSVTILEAPDFEGSVHPVLIQNR